MQNTLLVGAFDGASNFGDQAHNLTRIVAQSRADLLESPARSVFHAEVRNPFLCFPDFVDRENVRVIEARSGFGFPTEAGQGLT